MASSGYLEIVWAKREIDINVKERRNYESLSIYTSVYNSVLQFSVHHKLSKILNRQ